MSERSIVITGASSGLGKVMALAYAKEKATIINLSRNLEKMQELNSKLNNINNKENKFFSVDVSKYEEILKVKNDLLRENAVLITNSIAIGR